MGILTFLSLLELVGITAVIIQTRRIQMTNEEYRSAVGALAGQLVKVLAEIQQQIANIDTVPQDAVDRLTAAQQAAQALDDLNPDQPQPGQPAPEPAPAPEPPPTP